MTSLPLGSVTLWIVVLVAGSADPADPPPKEAPSSDSKKAENIADIPGLVEAHNRERAAAKLSPLVENPKLEAAALEHARDMAEHEKMTHEGSDHSTPAQRVERAGYHFRMAGENVAAGQTTVKEVMRSWMDSPPHKKNILGDFTEMGAACVKAEDGTPYWCVDFGRPWPVFRADEAAAEVIDLINRERKKEGKPPLKAQAKLMAAAQHHARDMARHDKFSNRDDDGLSPFERVRKAGYHFRRLGEASASGQPTPEDVVKSWLDDKNNRENLLGESRDIGVGYATSDKDIPYWVMILGQP